MVRETEWLWGREWQTHETGALARMPGRVNLLPVAVPAVPVLVS